MVRDDMDLDEPLREHEQPRRIRCLRARGQGSKLTWVLETTSETIILRRASPQVILNLSTGANAAVLQGMSLNAW